jgi:hypothetical protein
MCYKSVHRVRGLNSKFVQAGRVERCLVRWGGFPQPEYPLAEAMGNAIYLMGIDNALGQIRQQTGMDKVAVRQLRCLLYCNCN